MITAVQNFNRMEIICKFFLLGVIQTEILNMAEGARAAISDDRAEDMSPTEVAKLQLKVTFSLVLNKCSEKDLTSSK